MIQYKDPQRDRPKQDAHAERCIYWLSPHERARRRKTSRSDRIGAMKRRDVPDDPVVLVREGPFEYGRDDVLIGIDDEAFTRALRDLEFRTEPHYGPMRCIECKGITVRKPFGYTCLSKPCGKVMQFVEGTKKRAMQWRREQPPQRR